MYQSISFPAFRVVLVHAANYAGIRVRSKNRLKRRNVVRVIIVCSISIPPTIAHFNFGQHRALGQLVPLRHDRLEIVIAGLFPPFLVGGGGVIFAGQFPRHALDLDMRRYGFGVVGHDIAGRAQRGGQGHVAFRRSQRKGLHPDAAFQPVKGRDRDRPRISRLPGFRPRFLRRGQIISAYGGFLFAAVPVRLPGADFADVAAGRTRNGLYVAAIGSMLPALMGAVQRVTRLPVCVARVAAGGRLLRVLVHAADQLVGVAVRRVFVFAIVARYGLHITAHGGVMGRVVFTQAGACRGFHRVGRGPQLGKHQRGGQQRSPYPFSRSQHKRSLLSFRMRTDRGFSSSSKGAA